MNVENLFHNYSALGGSPKCDLCGSPVNIGEKVQQVFAGVVIRRDGELCVREDNYMVAHLDCIKMRQGEEK